MPPVPVRQRLHSRLRLWQLVRVLHALSSQPGRTLGVLALVLALRLAWRARKQARLVRDLNKIGTGKKNEWDVIIVGGGTAGCVLASRLSEDPHVRVLLLEAGQSGVATLASRMPMSYSFLFHSPHDWNLYTEPQTGCTDRSLYWPRGKMLGGSSSMNAMMFHAGAPSDYEEWARAADDPSWGYDGLRPYWRRFERHTPGDKHPLVDGSERGLTGLVSTGNSKWTNPLTDAFVEACEKIGIPRSHDVNTSKGSMGATRIMTYVSPKGERSSTESAYLTPEVLARPNLTVAVGVRVHKVLFESAQEGQQPRAIGVEFTADKEGGKGATHRAYAAREVVLCAGAVHTPHLLQLSGVGPAEHLAAHHIAVKVDLPGVGAGLEDHATVMTLWRDKTGHSLNYARRQGIVDVMRTTWNLGRWLITGGGPCASNIAEGAAFARSTDPTLFPAQNSATATITNEASAPDAPDLEIIFTPIGFTQHGDGPKPPGDLVGVQAILLRPQSQGTVRLRSANAFDAPLVDPGYLRTENDMRVLVRGVRLACSIGKALAHAGHVSTEPEPGLDGDLDERSDAEIGEVVRQRLETLYHPACSTRMGKREAGGVVDGQLRVHGVRGLRIADAGVIPRLVAGHTAAPCILIAEKCADMMRGDFAKV